MLVAYLGGEFGEQIRESRLKIVESSKSLESEFGE